MPFQEKVKKVDKNINLFENYLGARGGILSQFIASPFGCYPSSVRRNTRNEATKHSRQKFH
jgi:hypothetical protein